MVSPLLANPAARAILFALVALAIAAVLTPVVIRVASRFSKFDAPGARKIHGRPVPRLGGIAIYFALWASWFLFRWMFPNVVPYEALDSLAALFVGSTLIFGLGLYDDLHGANAYKKLTVQIIAALVVVWQGIDIEYLYNPISNNNLTLVSPVLSWTLTVAWIVVVTNAINLIDGLDGLAGGVCFITSLTLYFISRDLGIPHLPYFCACLAGALFGFLIYNFSPAKIFLGDSGSLVLGFVLACLSIEGTVKRSTAIVMFGPPLILALPMADTLFAIFRRFLNRAASDQLGTYRQIWRPRFIVARLKEIFEADQNHIHHGLLKIGLSHRRAVLILYCVAALLGASAYRMAVEDHLLSVFVVIGILSVAFAWLIRRVKKLSVASASHAPEVIGSADPTKP